MSLFQTLGVGASGMTSSSASLSVIGDNIANMSTTGYKTGVANFADMVPEMVGGLSGMSYLGRGSMLSSVGYDQSQGALGSTGMPLDIGILGNGMFQVNKGDQSFYSRDGHFHMDLGGFVVNDQGLRLQGYQAENGVISPNVGDLQVSRLPIAPTQTTTINLNASLSASEPFASTPLAGLTLDGIATTINAAAAQGDFSTSVAVYDSLGRPHDVTVMFEKSGTNDYTWRAVVDAGETDVVGGVAGGALEIASGTLNFNTTGGTLNTATQTATPTAWTWPGADPFTFNLDVGGTTGTLGSISMVDSTSYTSAIGQDGAGPGDLSAISVGRDGTISGDYTNGKRVAIGQVALATFVAPEGLARMGGNLWGATAESGDPALGAAESGSRGGTIGASLEGSNVELEEQFVSLIQTQRSYQANTGVIRGVDETLKTLIQLV